MRYVIFFPLTCRITPESRYDPKTDDVCWTHLPILHVLQAVLHTSDAIRLYKHRVMLDLSRGQDLLQ